MRRGCGHARPDGRRGTGRHRGDLRTSDAGDLMAARAAEAPEHSAASGAARPPGGRIVAIYAGLIAANLAAWAWALAAFYHYPVVLGTALLAYGLGLRHAIDADHIAAIDNVTRKLMQEGKRPVSVGFFFSLGHSTVVVAASVAIAATARALTGPFAVFRSVGSTIGTLV